MSKNSISLKEFNQSGMRESARLKTSQRSSLVQGQTASGDPVILDESGKKKRHGKYNAKKVVIDGIEFDSTWEGKRYSQIKILEKSGEVKDLKLQVPFRLEVNDSLICTYIADFVYLEDGKQVVEDAKGVKTPEYLLKKKLMKAIHGIEIRESYRPSSKSRQEKTKSRAASNRSSR